LNILLNFSDRMRPAQMQKLAKHTQLSVHNLQALLEYLLQWSASHTASDHSMRFEPAPLQLHELVQRNITLLQDTAAAKQLHWQVEVPATLQVHADANMLDFIIRNLLHNAIKFSELGGKVMITAKALNTRFAEVSVEDEGVGIAPHVLATLFHTEHPAATTKGTANEKGTGLGLLLCRLFTERCGGKIQVQSEEGKGSRFWFTVPLAQTRPAQAPVPRIEEEIC
ncbi:MAG: ATP-binding protein, partial [Hymenobacteraceae bacterium]|nr:ATP-binding protein [Hymenobacteraceae bacterium]